MPRIVRDLSILIAFCGAFYLLVVFVRGETSGAETGSNFSLDRIRGDQMIKGGNWEQAIKHFSRIVEKDKYNGLAMARLAQAKIEILFEKGNDYQKKLDTSYYSAAKLEEIWEALQDQAKQHIEEQKTLLEYEHYYPIGIRNLAQLHCFLGNDEVAVQYTRYYIRGGNYLGGPIATDPKMKRLRRREDFEKLVRLEKHYLPFFKTHSSDLKN
jgi:hypothetical protein